jgi:hypothetical protein
MEKTQIGHNVPARPINKGAIYQELAKYSREPFMDTLAYLMGCKPDREAVLEFANAHPDRWANAISTFSKMAGYHDKLEVEHNIHMDISRMGDAELEQRLSEMRTVIDITPDKEEEAEAPSSSLISEN